MKLFASDFDGTLFMRRRSVFKAKPSLKDIQEHKINGYLPEDIAAIHDYQQAGNLFGICTGRSYSSLMDNMTPAIRPDFVIASSGAAVYDAQGRPLFQKEFTPEAVKAILDALPDSGLSLTTPDHFYVSRDMRFLSEIPVYMDAYDPAKGEKVICISANLPTEEEARKIMAILEPIEGIEIFLNGHCLDIVPDGCSKAMGIERIAGHFHVDPDEIGAAGDSWNDLPMLEYVPHAYTFANCPEALKQVAAGDFETLHEVLEDFA